MAVARNEVNLQRLVRPLAACLGTLVLALVMSAVPARQSPGAGPRVDIALILAVDCSYSVDEREYALQMKGMANAFRHPDVLAAITGGSEGRIAVSVIQWSAEKFQAIAVPWQIVSGVAGAQALATRIETTPRQLAEGGTAIGAALKFSTRYFETGRFVAGRKVIDVSSDGRNNRGPRPHELHGMLASREITVNGLVILNEWPTLNYYFEQRVVTGPSHFVVVAKSYSDYADAIYRKLLREITGPAIG